MKHAKRLLNGHGSLLAAAAFLACFQPGLVHADEEEADPAQVAIGEQLFLETRFAQAFAQALTANHPVNNPWVNDPVVETTQTINGPLVGPFAGQSINCRACHLVDEQLDDLGMRSYSDFARRSPLPFRIEDNKTSTVRNSPPLVNASLNGPRRTSLHFDGEFASLLDLVKDTLTGRNYGWLVTERDRAVAHIARVIREDDGNTQLSQEFAGLPYRTIFDGADASIAQEFKLPESFRIDVRTASDKDIFRAVAKLIAAYTEQLTFAEDSAGFMLSPYDQFLAKNGLDRQPRRHESDKRYAHRLLRTINYLAYKNRLLFVSANTETENGEFEFHDQPFRFGPTELRGLKIFLTRPGHGRFAWRRPGGVGNCVACHAPPTFTDSGFHNTGVTQREYDSLHGDGAFTTLKIPGLYRRAAQPQRYLPATARRPDNAEPFRAIADIANPGLTDLGVWNVFANRDFPKPQSRLWGFLCRQAHKMRRYCFPNRLLKLSIARFKTPGLRDSGHGGPFGHNGQLDTIEDVITSYREAARLARGGRLRNGAPQLRGIRLSDADAAGGIRQIIKRGLQLRTAGRSLDRSWRLFSQSS